MKLLTKAIKAAFDASVSRDGEDASKVEVIAKFFDPTGRYTFYATEAEKVEAGDSIDGKEDYFLFGFCVSPLGADCDELGYVSLNELARIKGRFGLGIERDLHLPKGYTLADAYKEYNYRYAEVA